MEEVPYWDAQLFHDDDDDDDDDDETDDRYSENDDNDEEESYEDDDDDDDEDDLQSEDEEDDVPPPIACQIEVTGQEGEVASAVSSDGGGDQRDGLCCSICLEPWSSVGDHYVCCLPCGHVYGFSCIEKWLKRRKNHAPCPQCGRKYRDNNITKLYVSQICVTDSDLEKKILFLQSENEFLKMQRAAISGYTEGGSSSMQMIIETLKLRLEASMRSKIEALELRLEEKIEASIQRLRDDNMAGAFPTQQQPEQPQ